MFSAYKAMGYFHILLLGLHASTIFMKGYLKVYFKMYISRYASKPRETGLRWADAPGCRVEGQWGVTANG